jgi:glyoxylase I family protein
MPNLTLHHVSIVVSNLERSVDFYTNVIGLERLERPPFKSVGAWFGTPHQQIHVNEKPISTDREAKFDPTSFHFAYRVDDIQGMQVKLEKLGYREDSNIENKKRLIFDFHGIAGFPQLFLFDPDCNLVEINAATI